MNTQPSLKKPIILLAIVVLAIIGYGVVHVARQKIYTAKIVTQVTPTDGSTITLNGKKVKEGTIMVRPGAYKLTFSHPGFETLTQNTTVKKGEESFVGGALVPNSDSTKDWYGKHPEDSTKAEGISSKTVDADGQKQLEKLPLIQQLPLIDREYRIDYGKSQKDPNNNDAIAIYITYYTENGKTQALDFIRAMGYDPATLEIIYIQAPFAF